MEIMDPAPIQQYYQRDSSIPVFRVPPEILTEIFVLCACDYHYSRHWIPGSSTRSAPDWVNLSYVCRHWRNEAMNCPELWSYVFVTSRRWTEELLERSGQASLKISADLSHTSDSLLLSHLVVHVTHHMDRIEDLCISFENSDCQILTKFLSSSTPRLREFQISHSGATSEDSTLLPFQGKTLVLRELNLSRCSGAIPWHSFTLRGLTSLKLSHFNYLDDFRLDITELLDALCCTQSLEYLHLDEALTCARDFLSSITFDTTSEVNLPRLSALFIKAPLSAIMALLSRVNIPLKTRLDLFRSDCAISLSDEYHQFVRLLRNGFNNSLGDPALAAPAFRSLVIRSDSESQALHVVCNISKHMPGDLNKWGLYSPLRITLDTEDSPPLNIISDI